MLVVDSSAVLRALVAHPRDEVLVRRLVESGDLHAPHLIDVEVVSALRRLVRRGELSESRAVDAQTDFRDLSLARYPHTPLIERMWELRHNLTAYDAAFVALAEALDCPLITSDVALESIPGVQVRVEVFSGG